MSTSDERWRGDYGNEYNIRNANTAGIANNVEMFKKIPIQDIETAIEFGCGYGFNLLALKQIFPELRIFGVEINAEASKKAAENGIETTNASMNDFIPQRQYDLVLTKGILMYITEESIDQAYKVLYESSTKYICICEYYNPSLIIIDHRGTPLHKRDYGKIMDLYPDLKLVDYGFVYHKDKFPQDDVNWFLFEKIS